MTDIVAAKTEDPERLDAKLKHKVFSWVGLEKDEKGVRVVTIWTSDAFLMPSTTFTCPWFMPLLRDWVGAKSDDEASGSEAAQPRSQYPLLHIGSKVNCSAHGPCTKDDGDDGNGRDFPYALTNSNARALDMTPTTSRRASGKTRGCTGPGT